MEARATPIGSLYGDSTVPRVSIGCQKGTMRYLGSLRHRVPRLYRWPPMREPHHPSCPFTGPSNSVPISLDSKRPLHSVHASSAPARSVWGAQCSGGPEDPVLSPWTTRGLNLKDCQLGHGKQKVAEFQGRFFQPRMIYVLSRLCLLILTFLTLDWRRHCWVETGWAFHTL